MRRTIFALTLALGLLGSQNVAIAAATLSGETFTSPLDFGNFRPGNCTQPDGNAMSYDIFDGAATGPLPGIFRENGNIEISSTGAVTLWQAGFEVNDATSGTTSVQGDKTLIAGTATCSDVASVRTGTVTATLSYTAQFYDALGNPAGTETGTSVATITFTQTFGESGDLTGTFTETFGRQTTPLTKDDCKDGGWMNFPQFENQGDCIKFVNHMP